MCLVSEKPRCTSLSITKTVNAIASHSKTWHRQMCFMAVARKY